MLDFKLQYYFELYKDTSCSSSTKFKVNFIKKHGEFSMLPELVVMIQRYQLKKYGEVLEDGNITLKRPAKNSYNNIETARFINRFGTKKERERRKRKFEDKYVRK